MRVHDLLGGPKTPERQLTCGPWLSRNSQISFRALLPAPCAVCGLCRPQPDQFGSLEDAGALGELAPRQFNLSRASHRLTGGGHRRQIRRVDPHGREQHRPVATSSPTRSSYFPTSTPRGLRYRRSCPHGIRRNGNAATTVQGAQDLTCSHQRSGRHVADTPSR